MFRIDTESKAIALPTGDTLDLTLTLKTSGRPAIIPPGSAAVFGICRPRASGAYEYVFCKTFPIEGSVIAIRLTNADTRDLRPGTTYAWDVRVVTDPEYDEQGNARCGDDTDSVVSVFSGTSDLPSFHLLGVSSNV